MNLTLLLSLLTVSTSSYSHLLFIGGRGWGDFTAYMRALPIGSQIILGVLTVIAIFIGLTCRRWLPALLRWRARKHGVEPVWIDVPRVSWIAAVFIWLVMFPIIACFSDDAMTWILCFVFGWLGAFFLVIWYTCYFFPSGAMMWDGQQYWIGPFAGIGGFKCVKDIKNMKIRREMKVGDMRYIITYTGNKREKTYCYFAPNDFDEVGKRHLYEFVRTVSPSVFSSHH